MTFNGTTAPIASATTTALVAGFAIHNPNWVVAVAAVINVGINFYMVLRHRKKQ